MSDANIEVEAFHSDKELSFKQLVLSQIQKILNLSYHELRDSSRTITHANFTEQVEHEDTRRSYIQSVKALAILLQSKFDKDMKEKYKKSIEILRSYSYELEKKYKEKIEKIKKENPDLDKNYFNYDYFVEVKVVCAEDLFSELNLFLNRINYLTVPDYTSSRNPKRKKEKEE